MIDEVEVYGDEDGWHLKLSGDVDDAVRRGGRLDQYIDVRVDPQLLDDALARWREHQAEGDAVRRERAAAGGISWDEHRAELEHDPHEEVRERADTYRDIERGK